MSFLNLREIPGMPDHFDPIAAGIDDENWTEEDSKWAAAHRNKVLKAQLRLNDAEKRAGEAARKAAHDAEQVVTFEIRQREADARPPVVIGLPHHVQHVALTARLLPVPTFSPALARQASGLFKGCTPT